MSAGIRRVTPDRRDELEVVGTYGFPHEASLAKSALEAYGVEAWVLDEKQIRLRWYMGEAAGGVKVAVRRADADTAREILGGDHSADLAAILEARLPPAPDELCPHCGADALERVSGRTTGDVLCRMFGFRRGWRCRACGRS